MAAEASRAVCVRLSLFPQHHRDGFHGNLGDLHMLHAQRSVRQTQELPVPGR